MKIHCLLGLYIVFIAALFIGFNSGASIASAANQISNTYATPKSASPGAQRNMLIIQVDDMNAQQPRLQSVWLMAFYNNSPRVDLLPIYPTLKAATYDKVQHLPGQFELVPSGEPGDGFWLEMQEFNTWWNAYLMMDGLAFQKLGEHLDITVPLVDDLQPRSQTTLGSQVQGYQALCQGFSENARAMGFYKVLISLKDHARSNFNPGQLQDVWQQLHSYGQDLVCNFPSLQAVFP